jgi:hypothetical protein
MTLEWHDLLGIPFKLHGNDSEGMDCSTVAETVLKRLGKNAPPTSPYRSVAHSGAEMGSYFTQMGDAYSLVGVDTRTATELGDVVLARNPEGMPTMMFVLVDVSSGTFLTAEHQGGVRATRRYKIESPVAVYRLKEVEQ